MIIHYDAGGKDFKLIKFANANVKKAEIKFYKHSVNRLKLDFA